MKKLIVILAVVLFAATAQAQSRFRTDAKTPDAGIPNLRSINALLPYSNDARCLPPAYVGGKLFNELYR